jgi:hypothetical protein
MYRCQVTGELSKPGDKMCKIVVKTRPRVYTGKVKNEETRQYEEVEVGIGWEIVRELSVSEVGLAEWNSMTEDQRLLLLHTIDSVRG